MQNLSCALLSTGSYLSLSLSLSAKSSVNYIVLCWSHLVYRFLFDFPRSGQCSWSVFCFSISELFGWRVVFWFYLLFYSHFFLNFVDSLLPCSCVGNEFVVVLVVLVSFSEVMLFNSRSRDNLMVYEISAYVVLRLNWLLKV